MTINSFPIPTVEDIEITGTEAMAAVKRVPVVAYCDYSDAPMLPLTTTPTIVTGWVAETAPVGISESGGLFTVAIDGVYSIILERIYLNADNNPALLVNVSITVEADDQQGGGFVTVFNRTSPIPSATANDEPAVLSFTTPANRAVTAGTVFRVLVSAEDGGSSPQECYLTRMKIVANLIHKLP